MLNSQYDDLPRRRIQEPLTAYPAAALADRLNFVHYGTAKRPPFAKMVCQTAGRLTPYWTLGGGGRDINRLVCGLPYGGTPQRSFVCEVRNLSTLTC